MLFHFLSLSFIGQSSSFLVILQGFMIVDRTLYGSRSMLDQHRDMRLDIDNMTYEVIIIVQVLISFGLLCRNCWILKGLEWLTRAGITGARRKDWECEHGIVRGFDIQEFDRNNLLFSRSNARGRELCNLPGKDLIQYEMKIYGS